MRWLARNSRAFGGVYGLVDRTEPRPEAGNAGDQQGHTPAIPSATKAGAQGVLAGCGCVGIVFVLVVLLWTFLQLINPYPLMGW